MKKKQIIAYGLTQEEAQAAKNAIIKISSCARLKPSPSPLTLPSFFRCGVVKSTSWGLKLTPRISSIGRSSCPSAAT